MKYYPQNLWTHKKAYKTYIDILNLFYDTPNLEIRDEDTNLENIFHKPTGWYFYTTSGSSIPCFFNWGGRGMEPYYSSVDCPLWYSFYTDIFTKPSKTIQKAVYEAKIAKRSSH